MSHSAVLRRLLRYAKPYRHVFVVAIIGMVLVAAADALMAWMLKPLVDQFVTLDPVWVNRAPLLLIGVFALRAVGAYLSDYGMAWVGHKVVFDLRAQMAARLARLPVSFYDHQSTGVLISKLTFDAANVSSTTSSAVTVAIRNTLTIVFLLTWLLLENWRLTVIGFLVIPPLAIIIRLFNKRLRGSARDVQTATASLTHVLEESIQGQRVVKIFGGQSYEEARAGGAANRLRVVQGKQSAATALSAPIVQLLAASVIALILWFALQERVAGALTVGGFVAFVGAMLRLLDQIKGMAGLNATIQRGIAAAESVFTLLDTEPEHDRGTRTLDRARGEIRFENVSLDYLAEDGEPRRALSDVSLTIPPGQSVALVGPSGAGKTTLVNLIPRFYLPTVGTLRLDGLDLNELKLASLREQIALVSQDVTLFNDTIAANIAYGTMRGASREAIEEAARAAHAHEFIVDQPQGYDTLIGENGVRLSGGQRQRLAIARAILKNAPILILDEATSALDSESERHVQAALETLMQGRTTIVIAHRLSTIEKVDRIVVLDAGRIVEDGGHTDLLARDGLYARLHRIQFQGT